MKKRIVALLLALIGVAMYFSGYTMYAKINGDTIMDSASGYTVAQDIIKKCEE